MSEVDVVAQRRYTSFHTPYQTARTWLRDGKRQADAVALLTLLRERYQHVLAIGNELVLALLQQGRHPEALAELKRLERQFDEVDEETRCRWGRVYKEEGDRAWQNRSLHKAEDSYQDALREYDRGYELRRGHYPGINKATLLLLLGALARDQQDLDRSSDYLRQAEAMAAELLRGRREWSREFADDNIWHPATVGEAYLLRRCWAEAHAKYQEALSEDNVEVFHRKSMIKQAQRIRDAWRRLGFPPEPPFDNLEGLFGVPVA